MLFYGVRLVRDSVLAQLIVAHCACVLLSLLTYLPSFLPTAPRTVR